MGIQNKTENVKEELTIGVKAVKSVNCFVPGRVCLIGEHSDWAGVHASPDHPEIKPGRCLAYGTPYGLYSKAELHFMESIPATNILTGAEESPILADDNDDNGIGFFCMSSVRPSGERLDTSLPLEVKLLRKCAVDGGFFAYVYGTIAVVLERYEEKINNFLNSFHGSFKGTVKRAMITIENKTDLPIGKGLSSSAAVCVTIARCFDSLFDIGMSIKEIMDVAFCGEILTGAECGRLDQCVAYGPNCCIDLHFHGSAIEVDTIPLPSTAIFYFVVADLGAKKDTKKILRELGSCFPNSEHDSVKSAVREFLGDISLDLVEQASAAMRRGDAEGLGAVFTEYQRLFDLHLIPACDELQAPRLHTVLNDERVKALSCGGKGVGSQGDGSVQLVCRNEAEQQQLIRVLEDYLNCKAMPFFLKGSEHLECQHLSMN
ncbi:GHMP kinase [Trypanosoma theileri]|uniref:GHMP kinase n=1 Tax=Trypanosoma theileri TaxID=67003 RepID=A0A1X0P8P9_9TRYP|nr:GHMP kinase [Trypanosoma theileri]ORC93003.1 GHMP kinase [Trypanosoma theileri]